VSCLRPLNAYDAVIDGLGKTQTNCRVFVRNAIPRFGIDPKRRLDAGYGDKPEWQRLVRST
jgi:hypothetical protein